MAYKKNIIIFSERIYFYFGFLEWVLDPYGW